MSDVRTPWQNAMADGATRGTVGVSCLCAVMSSRCTRGKEHRKTVFLVGNSLLLDNVDPQHPHEAGLGGGDG